MGERFNWDRLLKRKPEKEQDNTIQLPTEPPGAPIAPLQASNPFPAPAAEPAPVAATAPPAQAPANRAPLVIEWDEFQSSAPEPTEPLAPIPIEPPAGRAPSGIGFWERLGQETTSAMATQPESQPTPEITGWTDVELTPAVDPVQTPTESSLMAGTRPAESYAPIETPYIRPSEEEIRTKTDAIATSPLWDEQPAAPEQPVQPPVFETPAPAAHTPPVAPDAEPPAAETPAVEAPTGLRAIPTKESVDMDDWLNGVESSPAATSPAPEFAPQTPEPAIPEISAPVEFSTPPVIGETTVLEQTAENTHLEAQSIDVQEDASLEPDQIWSDSMNGVPDNPIQPPSQESSLESWSNPTEAFGPEPLAQLAEGADAVVPPVAPPVFEPQSQEIEPETVLASPVGPSITADLATPEPESWTDQPAVHGAEAMAEPSLDEPQAADAPPTDGLVAQSNPNDFWASIASAKPQTSTAASPEPLAVAPEPIVEPAQAPDASMEAIDAQADSERELRIGDVLLKHKLVAPAQLERALARQRDSKEKLGQVLVSMGLISERRLLQVLATQKGVSPWHLEDDAPSQDALALVDHETCRLFQVLPVAVRGDLLLLAMRDSDDHEALAAVRTASGKRVEPVLADEARLASTIDMAYGVAREHHSTIVEGMVEIAHEHEVNLSDGDIVNPERPDHLSALFRELSADAKRKGATSITVAQGADMGEILYRIHGRLCPVQKIPASLANSIVANAKSAMEEGQTPFEIGAGCKVALTTGKQGENFVLTLPQAAREVVGLEAMDIEPENLKLLRDLIDRPYGLFLVTGSARSGKEATSMAIAQELERQGRAVTRANEGESIAEQIQLAVTSESEVILVGELQLEEDVRAAVKAASSGHLIIAETTANDAPTAIQQVICNGADPYLLATVLNGVWCQAVAPKLCLHCRCGQALTDSQRELLDQYGQRQVTQVFEAKGCDQCNQTGVSGEIVLSEVMPVSSDVSLLVNGKAPAEQIATQAGFAGYLPLAYDAMTRVITGDLDCTTAKRLASFSRRELSAISRMDTWRTQAS
ncbi:MAG: hypothetical protein JNM28_09360 [Armatimonadetes bacterium]|nr:hypothetical protein [Armatimonadota bacterium]